MFVFYDFQDIIFPSSKLLQEYFMTPRYTQFLSALTVTIDTIRSMIMELRLLIDASERPGTKSITLEGRSWCVSDPFHLTKPEEIPRYSCISYSWGSAREPNPLGETTEMSSRTIPTLAAAMRAQKSNAFWTDVFCVPAEGPERQATLMNMGYIYGHCAETIIVLLHASFRAVEHASRNQILSDESLRDLERDPWISSVWTYQEAVNCQDGYFVSEKEGSEPVVLSQFVNSLGHSLQQWRKREGAGYLDYRATFPRLDAFEDLIGDLMLGDYGQRSAYLVMSSMDRRLAQDPKNRFYAMIGVMTQDVQNVRHADLPEEFMALCDAKNDYSYIFSSEERDADPSKRWRPAPGMLRTIFPWHSWGMAQRAHHDAAGIWLEDMLSLTPSSTMGDKGMKVILRWMRAMGVQARHDDTVGEILFSIISKAGFSGSESYLTTTEGLFFPQHPLADTDNVNILVSTQVRFVFGAPALAAVTAGGENASYVPGLFVGNVHDADAIAVLL